MPNWINLANLFTLSRLFLVPFIIQATIQGQHLLALSLFALAALTDYLDGAAARRLNIVTKSGAYLDPIADKCLLSGVFLALAISRIVPWWLVVLIFARDLYILLAVGIFLLATPLRDFPPSIWGKISTVVQIVTVVLWMGRQAFKLRVLVSLSDASVWFCVAFTIWSGLHYTWRGIQVVRSH